MATLPLPNVTLCAATSVNVSATVSALMQCLRHIEFGECILFTDELVPSLHPSIRKVGVPRISSAKSYSEFMLTKLVEFVTTPHCLIVQWDGFVLDATKWDPAFLKFDYIGAPWPQFDDECNIGNGGFSLRSRRLLEACRDPKFVHGHPEDVAICRVNRKLLEREHDIRFADERTAARFSFERTTPAQPTFGFHGVFNMIPTLGTEQFWEVYRSLDDKSTVFVDFARILGDLGAGQEATRRRVRLSIDRFSALVRA